MKKSKKTMQEKEAFDCEKCYVVEGTKVIEGVILNDFSGLGLVTVGLNPQIIGGKIICRDKLAYSLSEIYDTYEKAELKALRNKILFQQEQIDFLEKGVKIEKRFLLVNILLWVSIFICSILRLFL